MAVLPASIHQRLRDEKEVQLMIDELKEVINYGGQRILDMILKCVESYKDESFNGCLQLADCVIDITWEMLNVGDWKEVPIIWRKIYTFAAIYKAAANYCIGLFEQCILAADYGLLMGAPIMGNILDDIISTASTHLQTLLTCKRANDDVLTKDGDDPATNDSHVSISIQSYRSIYLFI